MKTSIYIASVSYFNVTLFYFNLFFTATNQHEVATIYWKVEQKCRQFITKLTILVLIQQTSYIIALLFSIYCIYILQNFDTSTYFLPLRVAAPFETDTIFRWYLFFALEFTFGVSYMLSVIPTISYFVCCCFYLNALSEHFDHLIALVEAEFHQNHSDANDQVSKVVKESRIAGKLLRNAIDHHNKIYEWVFHFLFSLFFAF